MTTNDTIERELVAWFGEIAAPSIPDYTDDILRATAAQRQRPTWTFRARWIPMHAQTLERVPTTPIPWRTLGLLAVIALLAAALVAISIGSPPARPAPYGLAANGVLAYVEEGSRGISSLDPITGERVRLVTGAGPVRDPRWSLDGTRLAFIRAVEDGSYEEVVILDATSREPRLVTSRGLQDVDSDGLEWSPDGRHLLVVHGQEVRRVGLMDTQTGMVIDLRLPAYAALEAFFRPPDGRELVYLSGTESGPRISIASLPDLDVREIPLEGGELESLRPMGWTPDGARLVVYRAFEGGGSVTDLIDPETGATTRLDVAYGHVSNDGRWVAGLTVSEEARTCVVSIDGGPCRVVGDATTVPEGTHGKGLVWSPDDEWLVIYPAGRERTVLIDPQGGSPQRPAHVPTEIASWQRRAP